MNYLKEVIKFFVIFSIFYSTAIFITIPIQTIFFSIPYGHCRQGEYWYYFFLLLAFLLASCNKQVYYRNNHVCLTSFWTTLNNLILVKTYNFSCKYVKAMSLTGSISFLTTLWADILEKRGLLLGGIGKLNS